MSLDHPDDDSSTTMSSVRSADSHGAARTGSCSSHATSPSIASVRTAVKLPLHHHKPSRAGELAAQAAPDDASDGVVPLAWNISFDRTPLEINKSPMKAQLGPKMTIHSPAPWDSPDEIPPAQDVVSSASRTSISSLLSSAAGGRRSSEAGAASGRDAQFATQRQANKSHKVPSRSRSHSILSSRSSRADHHHEQERNLAFEDLVGLGLGSKARPSSPSKSRTMTDLSAGGESFLDLSRSASTSPVPGVTATRRPKISEPSDFLVNPIPFTHHDPVKGQLSLSSPSRLHGRSKTPEPIVFEMVSPAHSGTPPPASAPPNMTTFTGIGQGQDGTGSHDTSSTYYDLGTVDAAKLTSLKLISLEEARQRESEKTVNRKLSRPRLNPAYSEMDLSRASSPAPVSSRDEVPSKSPKVLKTRKSGFLKRMMGREDAEAAPPRESSPRSPIVGEILVPAPLSPTLSVTPAPSEPGGNRVAFGSTPQADPNMRIRKGLAPALSLRPVSMAFSAGLPSDFLATSQPMTTSPRTPDATAAAGSRLGPSSPSPRAPSFQSSIFDGEGTPATTPLTPAFSPLIPYFHSLALSPDATIMATATGMVTATVPSVPPSFASDNAAILKEQLSKARMQWRVLQDELEGQVRALQDEVAELKRRGVDSATGVTHCEGCEHCGCLERRQPASVLTRPRPVAKDTNGGLFGSGQTVNL